MSKSWHAGVLGHPIQHSLSPVIFQFFSREFKVALRYQKIDLKQNELRRKIFGKKQSNNLIGYNVTLPYKQKILKYLDKTSEEVKRIHAANVIHRTGQHWTGYNTDVFGITETLREHKIHVKNKKILVYGAGGAARAVLFVLGRKNAKIVHVVNRDEVKAETLCSEMHRNFPHTQFRVYKDVMCSEKYYLLVQATPQGMKGYPVLEYPQLKTPPRFVFDLVYNPEMTEFLKSAKKAGAQPISGLEMLIWQAWATWKIWFKSELGILSPTQFKKLQRNLRKYL